MKQSLLNIWVDNYTSKEALLRIEELMAEKDHSYVVFVNTDVIVKAESNHKLRKILNQADLTLTDGKPLIWISKLFHSPIKEKVSGSDLVPKLCAYAEKKGWSVFILGGAAGVPEKAAENLKKSYRRLKIVGTYSPPFYFENDKEELRKIRELVRKAMPDILIVSLGCPKQELFVSANYDKIGVNMSVCAGATVDFLAGNVRRCPKWVSNAGFEWFFRFLMEPRRLFKRYFIDDIRIIIIILKYYKQNIRRKSS